MKDWIAILPNGRSATRSPVTKEAAEAVVGARVFHYLDQNVVFRDGLWCLACTECGGTGIRYTPRRRVCLRCEGTCVEPASLEDSHAS